MEQYNEIGGGLALVPDGSLRPRDWLNLEGSYQFGEDYDGLRFDLTLRY